MDPSLSSLLRRRLRRPGDALPAASIGTVPILWNNVDLADLRHGTTADTILDEIARIGYDGTQLGFGFQEGQALRAALSARDLRLAEVYVSIPAMIDGPIAEATAIVRERLRLLHDGGGEVLCLALDGSPGRLERIGRAAERDTPRLTDSGWQRLIELLHEVSEEAVMAGHSAAFHPHAGTFVETPDEVGRLVDSTDPALLGI